MARVCVRVVVSVGVSKVLWSVYDHVYIHHIVRIRLVLGFG